MALFYWINYAVLASFLTLFTIEIGVALSFIFAYESSKDKLRRYLNPIWQITGTFAVFYVVNFVTTFPTALVFVGNFYIAPLLGAALFFILRNAFLVYSEYVNDPVKEKKYLRVYSFSALFAAFLVISVLSSGVSGYGVNLSTGTASVIAILFNPFDMLVFASVALLGLFIDSVVFSIEPFRKIGPICGLVALVLVFFGLAAYLPYSIQNLGANIPLFTLLFVLLFAIILFNLVRNKIARYISFVWLFYSIIFFGVLQYPYWFGGSALSSSYLVNAIVGHYAVLITIVGGIFLTIALSAFAYITYFKKDYQNKIQNKRY
ncbi:MAG TPA: cytochrome d ubiquinol oxidase subunit II [Candidatus Acidoferrum sp.]|nr:cytochrome d ubiquinol oxidase subunit II [Candidatus Acidoferrum sp.]